MGAPLNKDLSLKCLRFHMNSEIFLLDKKLDEIIKKLRQKTNFWFPDNATKTTLNNINSSRT